MRPNLPPRGAPAKGKEDEAPVSRDERPPPVRPLQASRGVSAPSSSDPRASSLDPRRPAARGLTFAGMSAARRAVLLLLLLLAAAPARARADAFLDESFVRLLALAGRGLSTREEAAWLVRGDDGRDALVHWPSSTRRRGLSWRRRPPAGALALLHTHPADGNPRPSERDRWAAHQLGVPVYTVSVWGVFRADPDGAVVAVASPSWRPSIDWRAAAVTPPAPGEALAAGGSSGAPFPETEATVR